MQTVTEVRESEADFESWFKDFMRTKRWTIRHISDSRKEAGGKFVGDADAADIPDWLCVRDYLCEWVELKGWQRRGAKWRRGEPTPGQLEFFEALRKAGQVVNVYWPEDRPQIERRFR